MINNKKGFTLVEVSIVIVVIGLIVSGVSMGMSFVNSAKLQNVITQVEGYKIAVNTFEMQYKSLPGDFNNAFAFWGARCSEEANDVESCNGNGDGEIDGNGQCTGCDSNLQEGRMFWRHLSLADMISETFIETGDWELLLGSNVPAAPIENTGFIVTYGSWVHGTKSFGRIGHSINLGMQGGDTMNRAALSTQDASAIDEKADDAEPDSGNIRPGRADSPAGTDCTGNDPASSGSGEYDLSYEGLACRLLFYFD